MEGTTPAHSEPSPVTTAPTELTQDMVTDAQPGSDETHVQTVKVAVVDTEKRTSLPQEHQAELQTAETSAAGTATAAVENGTAVQSPSGERDHQEMEVMESTPNPVAPTECEPQTTRPCVDEAKAMAKTKEKGQSGARKYVPSKKAMTDPLKMDTSSSLEMHFTSSMLSRQCDECHIIFSDNKSKERHLKLSHPAEYEQCILRNALFACYVCDRHFTNSTELMAHQKTHTDKKPFKCPICGLAFRKSTELTFHKKSHFGKDGYSCTDCGKPCKTLTLLKYHRRAHTGEMPYICKECGKRFPMPKALQKHILSHSTEGAEVQEGDAAAKTKKNDVRYSCSLCKASFKSPRTRLHHMKTKHNMLPSGTRNQTSAKQQVKQSTPIITPISVCQPGLLQLEPNGPLQKVDANVDTEQICRLIESLGNVQKVNQVVILGQVPPHAEPLELQQISHLTETVNLSPSQIDFMSLKQSQTLGLNDLNNQCDPMEQTIILEPITPDGQLESATFSELGAHIAAGEDIQLTLVHSAEAERPEGDVLHQIIQHDINQVQSEPVDQLVCHNDINLEQTVILELTPALIPTSELELSHTGQHNETPTSSLVSTSQMAKSPDQLPQGEEEEGSMSDPQLISAAELVETSIQTDMGNIPPSSVVSPDTITQSLSTSESNLEKDEDSQMQTEKPEHIHSVMDEDAPQESIEKVELELSEQKKTEKLPEDKKQDPVEEESSAAKENTSAQNNLSAKKKVSENKQKLQISELPVNVMSAQELVKVRKRKPARAFFFQGYIQEQISSVYSDDFQLNARPAKRQRNKKSRLVVKIGPQGKDKRNKKQKRASHQHQAPQEDVTTNTAEEKVAPSKKGRKRKKDRQVGHLVSSAEGKLPSTIRGPKVKKIKEHTKKTQIKKQEGEVREGVMEASKPQTASPVFGKKKQATTMKDQSDNPKERKRKKNLGKSEKVISKTTKQGSPITQDCLLLLRGHKQPQLKVYKLDPSKASSQTPEVDPQDSQTQQSKDDTTPTQESANNPVKGSGKKGGRTKKSPKVLSLLASLNPSCQPTEAAPTKPKTTRKRKSSSKIETEGVITSKQALDCKDCGQRFNELSSLQKHKATIHMLDSPDLTYTNGNVFEGVSRLNVATDWDTEPELGEKASEDRETTVSFPTLIPSPSLPVPAPAPVDIDLSAQSQASGDVTSQLANSATSPSELRNSILSKDLETAEPSASSESKQEKGTQKHPSSDSEDKGNMEEDVKEDLLLEVDLVTVGEQNDKEGSGSNLETCPEQNENESSVSEGENSETPKATGRVVETPRAKSLTSQTVSFSTHQEEIKEEEEEMLVQRKKRRGKGADANNVIIKRREEGGVTTETEKEQNECEVVFEKHPINPDLEKEDENQNGIKTCQTETRPESQANQPAAPVEHSPLIPSVLEGSAEEQVVFELDSVTTSVDEVMNEGGLQGGDEEDRDTDRSPGIILEKFLTLRQKGSADKTPCTMTAKDSPRPGHVGGIPEIKVEETMSDSPPVVPVSRDKPNTSVQRQQQRDVLVKEESSLVRWNMEPVNNGNSDTPVMQDEETTDCCVTKEFHSVQCIFYPVKEEEREVPIESTVTSRGTSTSAGSSAADQPELQSADGSLCEGSHAAQDNQEMKDFPGVSDFADGQDDEWPNPPDLQDFLLRAPDAEDTVGLELSDPQLHSEEEIMAYFYKNRNQGPPQPAAAPQSEVTSTNERRETSSKKPIEYFSTYFGWDTWVDVAHCTNSLPNVTTSVSAKEVAQFVGIHIAMGTLKFPSPKLYWQDLTKVPLICDAMSLSRFTELSRVLRLAAPPGDPINRHVEEERRDADLQIRRQSVEPSQCYRANESSLSTPQTDPLWKVQPLVSRFKAGCQALRRQDDYAVDQYLIPLTGEQHNKKYSFPCTMLIGFGGLLLHLDLKVNLSDKEEAVEKMVPRGSTVFLCKQELSTPAMLERLLAAGVHGAGRVGGARGQIGDEFVSSDGKLMLRRSHCGFILSTAGIGHRNMASLVDSFEKAHMSAQLNRDLRQLYPIPVTASAATCWPQAVLWYLTDQALVNSWLQYRQDHKELSAHLTFMDFRLEVSKSLILSSGSDTQDSVPPHPPTENTHATNEGPSPSLVEESPLPDAATRYDGSGHWPEQLGEGEGGRCRFGDCQRTSRVLCLKCCVFLCISRSHNCFLNFHNQASSGKEL